MLVVETVSVEFAALPGESAALDGLIDDWGPEGEIEALKPTVPLKPPRLANEMVELPVEPGCIAMYEGLAPIMKSFRATTLTDTRAEWRRLPLAPVTMTWYEPGANVLPAPKVRVEDDVPPALTETFTGFRVAVGPAGGTVAERFTAPEKPLRLVKAMVEVAEDP